MLLNLFTNLIEQVGVSRSIILEIHGLGSLLFIIDLFPEPMMFIWGRADHGDIFGRQHFTQWCYRIRFEGHDGRKLRAQFIQWGDYNCTDDASE